MKTTGKNITVSDMILILIITFVYSIVSFINLGDISVPCTKPDMGEGEKKEYITYAVLNENTYLESLAIYKGLGKCGVTVYKSDDNGKNWEEIKKQVCAEIYKWETIELDCEAETLCISIGGDGKLELFEAAFRGRGGKPVYVNTDGCKLFDEQELVPEYPTYKNETYFDEIYHARTAYEHIEGIAPYEISHPPLGKLIISVGIKLFGMNPFGWRVAGNVFGIMMLPLMYIFAKRLFRNSFCALMSTLFLAFDFMHFTQTRIATLDSFAVFFIMLMYYLMYIYYDSTVDELPYKKSLILLGLCGFVFGLGVATKWIAVYAGLGLAVLFAVSVVKRHKSGESPLKICLWCVLFFGLVPLVIYFVSYIPYFMTDGDSSAIKTFWDNQVFMLTYHGGLEGVHDFQSKWYTWPLMTRPVWYFGSKELAYDNLCSSIVAFGNPVVWWGGSICMLYLILKRRKHSGECFVIIGFLSQYLPWILIGRYTFIYHFFASVPFIILALVYVIKSISDRFKWGTLAGWSLALAAMVLFLMFYPVISGSVTDRDFVLNVLSWFDSWKLCF